MSERLSAPSECAQCGASIPPRATACPDCGADERTGWREVSIYDGMDLPDEAWSDARETKAKDASRAERRINGIAWYWWCVALALLFFLGLGALALL